MEAPHDAPPPGEAGLEQPRTLSDLGDWAKLAADYGLTLLQLFKAELMVTLSGLPRLLVLGVLLLPFALLAWVGLAVLLSWWAYAASASPALGFGVFFFLQALVCALLLWQMLRLRRTLFFPATRRQIAMTAELLAQEGLPGESGQAPGEVPQRRPAP